jgi:hypothetical protein
MKKHPSPNFEKRGIKPQTVCCDVTWKEFPGNVLQCDGYMVTKLGKLKDAKITKADVPFLFR